MGGVNQKGEEKTEAIVEWDSELTAFIFVTDRSVAKLSVPYFCDGTFKMLGTRGGYCI